MASNRIGSEEGPVVELLDNLFDQAVQFRASDIHLEPKEDHLAIRLRVDGILVPYREQPISLAKQLASRVKVLAKVDIAEKRLPQDGTFAINVQGERKNIRCSTFPTNHGEKVVLRILADSLIMTDLTSLGIPPSQLLHLKKAVTASSGLVLATGPTGAGKSSTLHSVLARLDQKRLNITTLEDPIEIRATGLTQAQINLRKGFTFAKGLRAILRQDPDVILVGEMRDFETAQIAFQASLTGHLVLSTLHTSSTVETITRLLDMGLEPYLVASSIHVIVAQRLVRLLCPLCREPTALDEDINDMVGFEIPPPLPGQQVYSAKGCPVCLDTGYRGRTGLFEVLVIDDDIRDLIKKKSTSTAYKEVLRRSGLPTLRRDGIRKVQDGMTTIEEIMRVT